MKIIGFLLACVTFTVPAKQFAIVIDDIGNHQRDLELLSLPGGITFSILPHTPYSQQFAFAASRQQRELLLHIPMQAKDPEKALGPGALTAEMEKWQLQMTLGNALSTLPQVKGVNNHMGSALTEQIEPMKWTMEILKKRSLYFLDSRTTSQSQAQHAANLYGVKNIARQVFLDNDVSEAALNKQWQHMLQLLENHEQVIIIAHPYPETAAFLARKLAEIGSKNAQLVPVSQLVEQKYVRLAEIAEQHAISGQLRLQE
ncbi:divergent polysaccharide deacetylase family protein [Pseudoalteromonas piscicida]|uniref:divergent polysaccharide deacetylase family protein n=1 Tax=Pseudoalteromonas piscicida TaxID=43662 RepID=UPI0030AC2173